MRISTMQRIKDFKLVNTLTLMLFTGIWAIPTVSLIVTSLRSQDDANTTGWWDAFLNPLGQHWTLDAYRDVFTSDAAMDMGSAFVSTIVVTLPATVLPILIAAHAAYAFTFLEFKGREYYFAGIVALMVVPLQSALVPVVRGLRMLKEDFGIEIIGTYPGAWLVHSAFALPLAIYILRNYMMTLPTALIEAARVDGATYYQIFWKLVMPMSIPALASFAIFQFLWVWNDYLIAFIFVPSKPVMTYQILLMMGQYGAGWQSVAAGSLISLAVPLAVFFGLQRFFIRGLTAGSVK